MEFVCYCFILTPLIVIVVISMRKLKYYETKNYFDFIDIKSDYEFL